MELFLIVLGSLILPLVVTALFVLAVKWRRNKDMRRSPLNQKRLYLPGEQLRIRIEKLTDELHDSLLMTMLIGPVMLCAYLYSKLEPHGFSWSIADWLFPIVFIFGMAKLLLKINNEIQNRRLAKEGLAAELITAQNLLPLMGEGCLVFNDVPASSSGPNAKAFNLDHVVIGPNAVFMVETKSRKKSTVIDESWKVLYDGKTLRFPDHANMGILEQAKAQARWLADYLKSATGDAVRVVPVVALPGWYVENQTADAHTEVIVSNCRNPKFMLSEKFGPPIPENHKRRISHALVQQYPEVEI